MTEFEDYARGTHEIELEIERKGIALEIDWTDETQVRALAAEALDHLARDLHRIRREPVDRTLLTKVELFGLAGLMLKEMEESAALGIHSHGGGAWKAFARALWAEKERRQAASRSAVTKAPR